MTTQPLNADQTPAILLQESCYVLGHDPKPLYIENDGHVEDYVCARCGQLI